MSNSDNLLVQMAYGTINDVWIGIQALDPGFLERPEWKNPFTGANFGNLDGTPCYNQTDAIPGLATLIMPSANLTKEFEIIKKLNCAQFSHLFKGTFINKLSSQTRGLINRVLNWGINKFNEKVNSGEVVLDAVDCYDTYDRMSTKK